ncbi:MAG: phospholipase [Bacteroidetes bacterium]|nr:phospholipase [Bacteroidota bacterium]
MRISIVVVFITFLFPVALVAQNIAAVEGKTAYSFLIHTPDDSIATKQPVFVFLHGRSLCGTNLERVKRYGALYALNRGQKIPGFIIAPQAQGAWNAGKVMEVVDYVLRLYPQADSSRIYICGMSLGGYGTMEVAGKYPDRVAAAVAICGGGNTLDAQNLAKVPIWLHHGTADRLVPISESRKIMKAVKKINPKAEISLNVIKGGTHGSVERLFHRSDIYNWMLKHQLKN